MQEYIRRWAMVAITTAAGVVGLADVVAAQGRTSEAAVVRVDVVAAPAPPVTRTIEPGWRVDTDGVGSWTIEVEVSGDAVLTLAQEEPAGRRPAARLAVRREGAKRLAMVTLRDDPRTRGASNGALVALCIER